MGCSFIAGEGGAPGSYTKFAGVLSNREIKQLIKDQGITLYFNETAIVKYFTYAGNSWVGYDDAQTCVIKEAFADENCLGDILGLGGTNDYKSPTSATAPMDIPLPPGFVPPQFFTNTDGLLVPANQPLPKETTIPQGGDDDGPDCIWPFCSPPPPPIPIPILSINFGPPKPTDSPCAWPTLTCKPGPGPADGSNPTSGPRPGVVPPVYEDSQEEEEEKEEEEEEEDEWICLLRPKTTKTRTIGVTVTATSDVTTTKAATTTTTSKAPKPSLAGPDWNKDVVTCYDSGQWTRRGRMIDIVDKFCTDYLKGKTITKKWNSGKVERSYNGDDNEVVLVKIVAFVEAKKECEWKVDVDVCKGVMRRMIDECSTNGENH
ncbi:hypothetical protein E8E11_003097 [Didymella keratinophila]|nr:hypothetical protein E8E11_003097 [Didymella keratinophila]